MTRGVITDSTLVEQAEERDEQQPVIHTRMQVTERKNSGAEQGWGKASVRDIGGDTHTDISGLNGIAQTRENHYLHSDSVSIVERADGRHISVTSTTMNYDTNISEDTRIELQNIDGNWVVVRAESPTQCLTGQAAALEFRETLEAIFDRNEALREYVVSRYSSAGNPNSTTGTFHLPQPLRDLLPENMRTVADLPDGTTVSPTTGATAPRITARTPD